MSIQVRQIHPVFVGEVSGVDLTKPLSGEEKTAIESAIHEYGVLVFRDQRLTDDQQLEFTKNFGTLELADSKSNITKPEDRRLGQFFADVSNLDRGAGILSGESRQRLFNLGNRLWHSDSSFRDVPARFSLLSARAVPARGGDTQFADMRSAYESLDDSLKREIEGLVCEHSLMHSRGRLGFTEFTEQEREDFRPVYQPLVRVHPATGRRSLFLSSHAGTIVGWPKPQARVLLEELTEIATQREFVYSHAWRAFDLVIWDNRRTMHRATRFNDTGEVRDMRRTTVAGEPAQVAVGSH